MRRGLFHINNLGYQSQLTLEPGKRLSLLDLHGLQFCWMVIAEPLNSAGHERRGVKIATAAEPECGEGERCKFDEIFAEVDESASLELSEAAGVPRNEHKCDAAGS